MKVRARYTKPISQFVNVLDTRHHFFTDHSKFAPILLHFTGPKPKFPKLLRRILLQVDNGDIHFFKTYHHPSFYLEHHDGTWSDAFTLVRTYPWIPAGGESYTKGPQVTLILIDELASHSFTYPLTDDSIRRITFNCTKADIMAAHQEALRLKWKRLLVLLAHWLDKGSAFCNVPMEVLRMILLDVYL